MQIQRLGNHRRNVSRSHDLSELDEPTSVRETSRFRRRGCNRQPRLADPTNADHRHHRRWSHQPLHVSDLTDTTDQRHSLTRQVASACTDPQRSVRQPAGSAGNREQVLTSLQPRQRVLTEVDQINRRVDQQRRRRRRHHHVPPVGDRANARGPIDRRPEVVPITFLGRTAVDPNSDPQRRPARPRLAGRPLLHFDSRGQCSVRSPERDSEPVPARSEHIPTVPRQNVSDQLVVTSHDSRHAITVEFPQLRRPLDVREHERHRPRRPGNTHLRILALAEHDRAPRPADRDARSAPHETTAGRPGVSTPSGRSVPEWAHPISLPRLRGAASWKRRSSQGRTSSQAMDAGYSRSGGRGRCGRRIRSAR